MASILLGKLVNVEAEANTGQAASNTTLGRSPTLPADSQDSIAGPSRSRAFPEPGQNLGLLIRKRPRSPDSIARDGSSSSDGASSPEPSPPKIPFRRSGRQGALEDLAKYPFQRQSTPTLLATCAFLHHVATRVEKFSSSQCNKADSDMRETIYNTTQTLGDRLHLGGRTERENGAFLGVDDLESFLLSSRQRGWLTEGAVQAGLVAVFHHSSGTRGTIIIPTQEWAEWSKSRKTTNFQLSVGSLAEKPHEIVIPVHNDGHWSLAVIHANTKNIYILDSKHTATNSSIRMELYWQVVAFFHTAELLKIYGDIRWSYQKHIVGLKQINTADSGVCLIRNAELLQADTQIANDGHSLQLDPDSRGELLQLVCKLARCSEQRRIPSYAGECNQTQASGTSEEDAIVIIDEPPEVFGRLPDVTAHSAPLSIQALCNTSRGPTPQGILYSSKGKERGS